ELPRFDESIPNATVPVGREAVLVCSVENLGDYKVAWIKLDTQTLLTIDTKVITRDSRIRSTNNFRQWYLHIRNIQEDDRGYYMCQINTEPMISVRGFLDVLLPPTIQDNGTSSDVILNERSAVSLHCTATGYPKPKIFWRREDGKDINLGSFGAQSYSAAKVKGNFLNLTHLTRTHMGAYLCIASNGIPPSVSKRIMLEINFPPQIRVPNQVIGAVPGNEVTLECKVQAWPRPLTSWVRNEDKLLLANTKYQLTEELYGYYNLNMKLKISHLQKEDFNSYKCGAKNSFGEKEGFIRLHALPPIQNTRKEISRYHVNQPRPEDLSELKNISLHGKDISDVPAINSLTDQSSHLMTSNKGKNERMGSLEGSNNLNKEKDDRKPTRQQDTAFNHSNRSYGIFMGSKVVYVLVVWIINCWTSKV
ncbi:lachesin-like, partial [Limulus polyphemus]|uniref:Lachesin-like n=1 Tax=Limulus polyphemus TaxID=6850 RepID=A0ABM1SX45_LIMPO